MSEMSLVPLNHPLMLAWTAYMNGDDFKNSLMWAMATKYSQAGRDVPNDEISMGQREEHTKGSLWAAFEAGFRAATERAASLHEMIRPTSDQERHDKSPGAGAMGAVIEYRDTIRDTTR